MVWHFRPVEKVPALTRETYVPRGGTPLLDALGRGINDIEASIRRLQDADRPATVIVAVITDEQENSSKEFDKNQVEQMVRKRSAASWEFVFLSADLAAIGDAMRMGFRQDAAVAFDKSPEVVLCYMDTLSTRVSAKRSAPSKRW